MIMDFLASEKVAKEPIFKSFHLIKFSTSAYNENRQLMSLRWLILDHVLSKKTNPYYRNLLKIGVTMPLLGMNCEY